MIYPMDSKPPFEQLGATLGRLVNSRCFQSFARTPGSRNVLLQMRWTKFFQLQIGRFASLHLA